MLGFVPHPNLRATGYGLSVAMPNITAQRYTSPAGSPHPPFRRRFIRGITKPCYSSYCLGQGYSAQVGMTENPNAIPPAAECRMLGFVPHPNLRTTDSTSVAAAPNRSSAPAIRPQASVRRPAMPLRVAVSKTEPFSLNVAMVLFFFYSPLPVF